MKKIFKIASVFSLIVMLVVMSAGCGTALDSSDGGSDGKGASYEVGEATAEYWTNSINSTWVQVIIPVTNTGDEILSLSSATIDVEDAEGNLIASLDLVSAYPDVIGPGETAYFCETTIMDNAPASALKVTPHFDCDTVKNSRIDLEVSDTSISDDYGDIKVLGRVTNTSEEELDFVEIVAFFYDAEGKIVGHAFTYADGTLKPGDSISFDAITMSLPSSVNASTVADYKVFAYQNDIIDF